MKTAELKSILLEILSETIWGQKLRISIDGKIYPALICKNVSHGVKDEGEYRMSWFDPNTMEPKGHYDFSENIKNYILQKKEVPMAMKIKCFKGGQPIPKLIFEKFRESPHRPAGDEILVGTIDADDDWIEAKFGGAHATLKTRNNRQADWRFNDESQIVYWHDTHPKRYEELVDSYIKERLSQNVKKHITLSNLARDPDAYEWAWNDAHGIEQDILIP